MTDFSEMLSMAGSNLPAGINKDRLDKIYAGLVKRGVSEEDIPVVMSYILEESGAEPFRKDRYGIGLLDGIIVEDNMFEDDEDRILSQQLDSIVAGIDDGSVDTFVPLGDTVYGNALQRRYADGGELPSEEYVFPYYPSRTDEAVLRYFKGSPYSMPLTEVGADGKERIVGMDDITDSVVTGTDAYLYDDAFMKSRTVYQDTDGKYIMVDNNVLPKLKSELIGREVSFEDLQKEMPSMSYLGGNDYRLRTAMLIPGLFDAVKKKADSYGLNPNLILNRLIREGFIDSVAREFNESDDKKHFFTDGHIWEGSRSGFSEFGFDDVGANLMNKLYSLKDPTAEWYWDDDIAPENEKGRQLKYVPIVKDLNSALELLSAELAYRKDVLQKRGIPEEDLDIYTNAAYNAGLYHPMLNDRERILSKYNIPDWYGKARARAFGGNLYDGLSGTSQMQRGPIYDPNGLMVTPAPVRTMDVAVTDMAHVQPQAVVVSSGQEVGPIKGFSYSRPVNLKQTLLKSLGEVYSVPDASAINPTLKSDKAIYTPDREYNEALALGSSENSAIAKALANLPKDEKDIKELQGMLLDSGYYDLTNITPKITAKTTDEIKALQQMLIDNGYDLGKYGVDGKIGSYTRNAYAQYVKDYPDESLRQTIVDGKFGKASKAAYRKYLQDIDKKRASTSSVEILPTIETPDELMSLAMTDAISDKERNLNRLTLFPEHLMNQVVGGIMGDRGREIAASVEAANAAYKEAIKTGNVDSIAEADSLRRSAREQLVSVPGRKSLTTAEKKQAMAILTELSGGKQFSEEIYKQLAKAQNKNADEFDYVGIGRAGYTLSNKREDRDLNIAKYDKEHGFKTITNSDGEKIVVNKDGTPLTRAQHILRTDARIYNDPNRGRMGSWSVRIKDGFIEIFDRFEATEAKEDIAKGKNDDSAYNEARASWKPGTTHKLLARIPLEEYQEFYESAKRGQLYGNK